ncbi:PID-CTERM protein-sorting domain-containing protein [Hymenobacter radiodurans]|uniref:PID-CTERM protein-sorting domain-containing protein n=1 Tax=Hymenobacter radiodurans TaxID=2496028 RepID=UPI0010590619|nr:hypothetical protein [Hymenobacter radiodurans]
MKKLVSLFSLSALVFLLSLAITPVQGKDKDKGGPTDAPIDGGASLLLAGGAAYALRRINKARLNKKAQL